MTSNVYTQLQTNPLPVFLALLMAKIRRVMEEKLYQGYSVNSLTLKSHFAEA